MKNIRLVKVTLIMIIGLVIVLNTNLSFAANNIPITDLTGTVGNNTTENSNGNSTTTGNNVTNNTASNNVLTTNNTSNYNNTNLPNTGIGDSMPSVILLVIFGISAIYAYKKIQDYKNI